MSGRVTAEEHRIVTQAKNFCFQMNAVSEDDSESIVRLIISLILEAEHASIDACISIVKSRRPYDQGMVREMEKLKE